MKSNFSRLVGAHLNAKGETCFRVFAPFAKTVTAHILKPKSLELALEPESDGYFSAITDRVAEGSTYKIKLGGHEALPDPASRFQPEGVHGPSQVVGEKYKWNDAAFNGIALDRLVVYELHIGTFSPEGTFAGAIADLERLKKLGITAIQVMPIAQFPGERNWGYDGVYPFAVQNSYGGPTGFKQLIDAAHGLGLAVILDVVYNHLGPEGNYFSHYGPYYNDDYRTPWGHAINFDGAYSTAVRAFYLQNARQWFEEFHIDGLRLDAVHAIHDESALPFLEELAALKKVLETELHKSLLLIAESDLNDSRLLRPRAEQHIGLDAQYNDDLHHVIHSLITGERFGYYGDFGSMDQLVKCFNDAVVYDGQFSKYRHRNHGRSFEGIARKRLLTFTQNHDQIGNRPFGKRLCSLVDEKRQRLAAALNILSPFTPALFMGEEYGEDAPFLYFADHSDKDIIKATREGRQKEWGPSTGTTLPDPFALETFTRCKLRSNQELGEAGTIQTYYKELLALSAKLHSNGMWLPNAFVAQLVSDKEIFRITMCAADTSACLFYSMSDRPIKVELPPTSRHWKAVLESQGAGTWQLLNTGEGQLAPYGVVAFLAI